MLDELDPSQIEDSLLRRQFVALINLLEKALSENTHLKRRTSLLKTKLPALKAVRVALPSNQLKTLLLFLPRRSAVRLPLSLATPDHLRKSLKTPDLPLTALKSCK